MTTKSEVAGTFAVAATTAQMDRALRHKAQELWAGLVYILVWSLVWLSVLVGVLAPLDAFFAGGAQ